MATVGLWNNNTFEWWRSLLYLNCYETPSCYLWQSYWLDRPAATCDNLTDWTAQLLLVTILLIGPPFSDDKLTDFIRHQDVTWLTSLCFWLILFYLIINAMTILQPNRKQYSFSLSVFIQIFIKLWSNQLASVVVLMKKSLSVRCCS
jgi:hypothetical protein